MKSKDSHFKITRELDKPVDSEIVKFETRQQTVIKPYEFERLKKKGEGDYGAVKAKYGPLAATDAERVAKTQKDSRFSLNHLLREPLSIQQEESRVIADRVNAQIGAMTAEAKSKATQEGYKEGLEKGYSEAFSRFREEGKGRLDALTQLISGIEGAKDEIFKANERFLVDLIFHISKKVLLKELATDRDYLLRLCKEIIEHVGFRDDITVKLNPEDLTSVGMLREGLDRTLGEMKNLSFEPTNQVKQGGCVVETQWNVVDASLENQLAGIHDALVGKPVTPGEVAG